MVVATTLVNRRHDKSIVGMCVTKYQDFHYLLLYDLEISIKHFQMELFSKYLDYCYFQLIYYDCTFCNNQECFH